MDRSVLIVDDHAPFRRAARRMLELSGWRVVGEADDGASALKAVRRLAPEVVLLDVGLPDMSGLEVARRLCALNQSLAVVMVSTHDSEDFRELALANGAHGFLSKTELNGVALQGVLATGTE